MVRCKAFSKKKQQSRGVDFKKIKRKLGRKLPPPKNATNTEIKSKAIILPEQSIGADREGLAVSNKGLTLKELLQQSSHHNARVRKDALAGIKDLFQNHPAELRLHRYAVIEKLRERVCDDDKSVRETLYQLLKVVIFPGCKEDIQGLFVSLMMSYIFNAMTHLAIDVRLTAFRFFDLVVQYHPPSFSMYAEQILQKYEDILRKNQFYVQDKGKLKTALSGLVRCLLLLPCDEGEVDASEKTTLGRNILHGYEADIQESAGFSHIFKKLKDLVVVLTNCFQDFIPVIQSIPVLDAQSFDCMYAILQSIDLAVRFCVSGEHKEKLESKSPFGGLDLNIWDETVSSVLLKKLLCVFPLTPIHNFSEKDDDRYFRLNIVITKIFLQFSEWICPPAELLIKFLEFLENAMLGKICRDTRSGKIVLEKSLLSLLPFIPKLVWRLENNSKYRLLQAFTKAFSDCSPESSLKLACVTTIKEFLIPNEEMLCPDASDPLILGCQINWVKELPHLLILLGEKDPSSSKAVLRLLLRLEQYRLLSRTLNIEYEVQCAFRGFYSTFEEDGTVCYGPFIRLDRDCQELAICCLYQFDDLDRLLLKSVTSCCLCPQLEPFVLFRIVEVLQSAYKAEHIRIADHLSFLITLLSRFKVSPENNLLMDSETENSNRETFKTLTRTVGSFLLAMGDSSLVFHLLQRLIFEQIMLKPSIDNACALLRVLVDLEVDPSKLSEQQVDSLGNFLLEHLVDFVHFIPEELILGPQPNEDLYYYLLPCYFLLSRSHKLLTVFVSVMVSMTTKCCSSLVSGEHTQNLRDPFNTINAVVSLLILMHKDLRAQKMISVFKAEMGCIFQSIFSLQLSENEQWSIEVRHKIKRTADRLKIIRNDY